jgi:ATP-binding cassette subfamily B protein
MLLSTLHALLWTAGVIATKNLFDTIVLASEGQAVFWDCVIPILILAAFTFGQQFMNGLCNFMFTVAGDKSENYIRSLLHRKLQKIDPARFEDTAFLDDLNKAREGVKAIPPFCDIILIGLFFYGVYFASIGWYLASLKPILLITLMLAFIPALLAQIIKAKVFTKLEELSAPIRREYEYYQKTLCDREYFKETRILGAYKFFHKLFSDTMALITRKTWQAERKTALLQLMLSTISFAGMAVASYILFTATMAGEVTVGAFAAVFAAIGNIFYIMHEVVNYHIGNMNRDVGKVKNFVRMLDMPEQSGVDGKPDFTEGVIAESVSFTYPGREEPAVKNVSLSIAYGETIAIVGENGAGKSTLVRLLTGLYRPSDGRVSVGGLDTVKTAPASLYQGISGVFQKYQRYKMTLYENVEISDIKDEASKEKIDKALDDAGVELDGVEHDIMLSPEFDGIDLSGGQWQRLAIARGLYKTNDFIVLDEPTAAIDPIEETRVYTQFQKLAEGKCAVIVTHRLGSAKLAHKIVVMDSGEITDIGTHEELISRSGKYADMWSAQAVWYQREE